MRRGILVICLLTAIGASAGAGIFDGRKKGFADGLAIGGGAFLSRGDSYSDGFFSFRYLIGWGFGQRNVVFWDNFATISKCSDSSTCMWMTQGLGWQHYWLKSQKMFSLAALDALDDKGTRYTASIGLGYEFHQHIAASLSYVAVRHSGGNTPAQDALVVHLWYIWY